MDKKNLKQPAYDVVNGYEMDTRGSNDVRISEIPMTKLRIYKNVAVMSTGFLFLFTAFQSMANLQTSLNKEDGVGAYSLSAIYLALIVSCIFLPNDLGYLKQGGVGAYCLVVIIDITLIVSFSFLPTFIISRLGCKWTIPLCVSGYAVYMAANFYAVVWLMTVAAILVGICAAPMWSAKCTYLTQVGVWYSKLTKQSEDAVINNFFGFFFMVFQTSQIWGNLISSTVLEKKPESNMTENSTVAVAVCGAEFFPESGTNNTGFKQPEELVRNLLIIYLCCAVAAVVIVAVLLDPIKLDRETSVEDRKLSPKLMVATVKHLVSSPAQMLLVPLTVYSGVEQAFIGGDFTQSYVSCTLGVSNVGYIFICFGVVDASCSFIFGRLVECVGRVPFFVLATFLHGALQIILLLWIPDPEVPAYYYVIAAFWGMGDAVIQTQINALYGALFTDNAEAGFANYRLWESAGFAVTYLYQNSLRTKYKLYISLGFLAIGMLGYAIVEVRERRKQGRKAEVKATIIQ